MTTILNTVVPTSKGKRYRYSEIFGHTFQGEGRFTGVPTVWVRFWGCNFNCHGFSQKNPDKPETWELPFLDIDPTQYKSMEELPVFSKGCDSSYSWAKKFSHLAHQNTAEEISAELRKYLQDGRWVHPRSKQDTHLALTGGEPMMSQTAIVDLMDQFHLDQDVPLNVTIETNGTQMPRAAFTENFRSNLVTRLFWSVSPKLYVSGEKWSEAIRPDVVAQYRAISDFGQLKYVSNGTQRSWDEVERATDAFREAGIDWPVWIMPVGADLEGQALVAADVAEEACKRGYNVAARVHTYVFGNVIGK